MARETVVHADSAEQTAHNDAHRDAHSTVVFIQLLRSVRTVVHLLLRTLGGLGIVAYDIRTVRDATYSPGTDALRIHRLFASGAAYRSLPSPHASTAPLWTLTLP